MSDDEKSPLPQPSQGLSADTNTLDASQNAALLPGTPPQPKIFLPGQEAVTPTTYSGNTIPFGVSSSPADVYPSLYGSPSSSMPKAEPLGASIFSSYPNSNQLPPLPAPNHRRFHISRGAWWLTLPIGIAVFAIVLALVAIPVSAAWLANDANKTAAKSLLPQSTTVAATPILTSIPTVAPTPTVSNANSISANGITLTPDHFDVQNDCVPDHEFRCTITLSLSSDADNAVSWSASIDGVDSSFHPHRGTLEPGQQEQIIVYLQETCPIDASFIVALRHHHSLKVPLQCGG